MTMQVTTMIQGDIVTIGITHFGQEGHLLLNLVDVVVWTVQVDDLYT